MQTPTTYPQGPKIPKGPKISQTSKLGARSWSLQARETCPGSIDESGELVPACAGCYATSGTYYYPKVIQTREHNREDWKRPEWVSDMVQALENDRYFRWFDSGDCYALELAEKILEVMRLTPWVKHWIPTRMYKFPKFMQVFVQMQALDNVMVRFSSDSVNGEFIDYLHGSTIIEKGTTAPAGAHRCESPANGGKCGPCRACWDKEIPVIAYQSHGVRMRKVIRISKEKSQV